MYNIENNSWFLGKNNEWCASRDCKLEHCSHLMSSRENFPLKNIFYLFMHICGRENILKIAVLNFKIKENGSFWRKIMILV